VNFVVVILVVGSHRIAQAGHEFLGSRDLPALASKVSGNTAICLHTWTEVGSVLPNTL
jgi:hypothetical protein